MLSWEWVPFILHILFKMLNLEGLVKDGNPSTAALKVRVMGMCHHTSVSEAEEVLPGHFFPSPSFISHLTPFFWSSMCQSFPPAVVLSKYLSFILVTLKPRMTDPDEHKLPSRFANCQPRRGSMKSKGMQFQWLPHPKLKTTATKTIVVSSEEDRMFLKIRILPHDAQWRHKTLNPFLWSQVSPDWEGQLVGQRALQTHPAGTESNSAPLLCHCRLISGHRDDLWHLPCEWRPLGMSQRQSSKLGRA